MNDRILIYLIIAAAFVVTFLLASSRCSWKCDSKIYSSEPFTVEDQQLGKSALQELEKMLSKGVQPHEISDEELTNSTDDIYIVKLPSELTKEKLESFGGENAKYWPSYYYSYPYNTKSGKPLPPGMYSRLHYWSPGYYTGSGWSYYMRPGMGHKSWPRNRWIRNTQDGKNAYYYLTNRGDYIHKGTANYADTPLKFHS